MKRNTFVIGGVAVIALTIAAIFGWETLSASAASTIPRVQTATVQRGTLVASVSAAGNVSTPEQASMSFQTAGRVAEVNVHVGDAVKKGQVLMSLDTTDLDLALKTAQANLANTQANYDSAKIKNSQNPNQLVVAKAALDKAQVALKQAQSAYDKVAWRTDVGMTPESAALQQASIDYQSELANYQIAASGINDTAMRAAQAQVDAAQIAVDVAQRNMDKAKIIAPFDGTVAAVNYSVGDTTGTTAAVSLVNLANLQVKVNVAEVDMPKIKNGEKVQITFDALAGKTYSGQVLEVGPAGTVTQGVVNYPVTIGISNPDSAVKPGLTANLSIAVDERDNVLLVPTRAVRTQGNQKVVSVIFKGQTIQVPITTGLTNDQSVEVTSGLQEGDTVAISQTQTQGGARGGGIPGGGPFFFGRGG